MVRLFLIFLLIGPGRSEEREGGRKMDREMCDREEGREGMRGAGGIERKGRVPKMKQLFQ